jgi:hypothetical protein
MVVFGFLCCVLSFFYDGQYFLCVHAVVHFFASLHKKSFMIITIHDNNDINKIIIIIITELMMINTFG